MIQTGENDRITQAHEGRCALVNGTVYGVALYAGERPDVGGLDSSQINAPTSPVMFIKPRNTFLASGGTVHVPPSLHELEARPALALVFGRDVRQVRAQDALEAVSGFTLAIDLTEPETSILRPPVREKCRDGFLPIGPQIGPRNSIPKLESLVVRLLLDGKEACEFRIADRLHSIGPLVEDVSAYMTFRTGDVLLITDALRGPRASVGCHLAAEAEGIGRLECSLAPEEVLR